ncbi:hypothetical protein HK101_003401, partial [Irineochytrium annulatum]
MLSHRTSFIAGRFLPAPAAFKDALVLGLSHPPDRAQEDDGTARGRLRTLVNPATGRPLVTVVDASKEDVDEAVRMATHFEWRSWVGSKRRDAILHLAKVMEDDIETLAMSEAITGKPIEDARFDVRASVDCLRFFAGLADKLHGRHFHDIGGALAGSRSYTIREPVVLATWKLAPALAAGNTCVLKPAAETPFSSLRLAHLVERDNILPKGCLSVVLGGAEVGEQLAMHPDVARVSFTGSTDVGRRVVRASVADGVPIRRTVMELGGKNAAIVCADADLEQCVQHVAEGAFCEYLAFFMDQGLRYINCCACSRIFVHRSILNRFSARLNEEVTKMASKIGDPVKEETRLGPLVNERAMIKVLGHVDSARRDGGAKLLCGGNRVGKEGYYVEPTVFTNVRDDDPVATEEIFGPVLAVMTPL